MSDEDVKKYGFLYTSEEFRIGCESLVGKFVTDPLVDLYQCSSVRERWAMMLLVMDGVTEKIHSKNLEEVLFEAYNSEDIEELTDKIVHYNPLFKETLIEGGVPRGTDETGGSLYLSIPSLFGENYYNPPKEDHEHIRRVIKALLFSLKKIWKKEI